MKALVYNLERDARAVSADAFKQRKRGISKPDDVSAYLWNIRETDEGKFAVLVGDDLEVGDEYADVTYSVTTYDEVEAATVVTEYTVNSAIVTEYTVNSATIVDGVVFG